MYIFGIYRAALQVKAVRRKSMCFPVPVADSKDEEKKMVQEVEVRDQPRPPKDQASLVNPFEMPEPSGPLGHGGC